MSDSGLFSGIYQGIVDRAELLDRVLVRIKAGAGSPDDDQRRLAEWLVSLSAQEPGDAVASTVRILLRGQGGLALQEWVAAGEALRANRLGPEVVAHLEGLARALDREQAAAFGRFRGET